MAFVYAILGWIVCKTNINVAHFVPSFAINQSHVILDRIFLYVNV